MDERVLGAVIYYLNTYNDNLKKGTGLTHDGECWDDLPCLPCLIVELYKQHWGIV